MADVYLIQLVWSDSLLDIKELLRTTLHDALAIDCYLFLEKLITYLSAEGPTLAHYGRNGLVGHAGYVLLLQRVNVLKPHLYDQAIQQVLAVRYLLR